MDYPIPFLWKAALHCSELPPKGPCSALLCAGGRGELADGLETTSCHILFSTMSCLKVGFTLC